MKNFQAVHESKSSALRLSERRPRDVALLKKKRGGKSKGVQKSIVSWAHLALARSRKNFVDDRALTLFPNASSIAKMMQEITAAARVHISLSDVDVFSVVL